MFDPDDFDPNKTPEDMLRDKIANAEEGTVSYIIRESCGLDKAFNFYTTLLKKAKSALLEDHTKCKEKTECLHFKQVIDHLHELCPELDYDLIGYVFYQTAELMSLLPFLFFTIEEQAKITEAVAKEMLIDKEDLEDNKN